MADVNKLEGYYIKKIGENRGKPRVWLDRLQTEGAGLAPGEKYDVVVSGKTIVLTANKDGSRVVSSKRSGDKVNPIIDLNSDELLAVFDGMAAIRVVVRRGEICLIPLASELKKQERLARLKHKLENGIPLDTGSISHGGGIMAHALHEGLKVSQIPSRLTFVNEIREELLDHASIHNDAWSKETQIFSAPMQELAFDEKGLALVPKLEILDLGLPCSGASRSGKAVRSLASAEEHPEVGHLVVASLIIVAKTNPAVLVYENVPDYSSSHSASILRTQLKELGYKLQERFLNGVVWGELENRTRWCMLAVTEGLDMDFNSLMPPANNARKISEVLEDIPADDVRWSKMSGLRNKEMRDKENGKGFAMQVFDADSEFVNTMTKGYAKVQSTTPKLAHPDDPDLLRQFTVKEHAAFKNIPLNLVSGLSETIGHQVLGQSVIHPIFKDVGQLIGNSLRVYNGDTPIPFRDRTTTPVSEKLGFSDEFLELAGKVVGSISLARQNSSNTGIIVAVDKDFVIQDVGRKTGVAHRRDILDGVPQLGKEVQIAYNKFKGVVKDKERPQLSLGL